MTASDEGIDEFNWFGVEEVLLSRELIVQDDGFWLGINLVFDDCGQIALDGFSLELR